MKLVQYLKPLSDLSLFYAVFGSLLAFIFPVPTSLLPLLLYPVVQCIAYQLKDSPCRFLPLFLLLIQGWFITHPVQWVMLGFVALYFFYIIKKKLFYPSSLREVPLFQLGLKLILPFLIFTYILGLADTLNTFTLPIVFLYLVSTNLLLRLLKADANTLSNLSFMRFNLCTLVAVFVSALVLSSQWFLSTVTEILRTCYLTFIAPVILFVVDSIFWIFEAVYRFLVFLFSGVTPPEATPQIDEEVLDMGETIAPQIPEPVNTPDWLPILGLALLILLFILLLIWLYRKMLASQKNTANQDGITITHQTLNPVQQEKMTGFFLSPREKVRNYYREFLIYAVKQGVHIRPCSDTTEIEALWSHNTALANLTQTYRQARYNQNHPIQKEQVATAKQALKELKSQKKPSSKQLPS